MAENEIVFTIPKQCVGLLKGVHGKRILRIEQLFDVGIWIDKYTGPDEVLVHVYGMKENTEQARQHMHDIVQTESATVILSQQVAGWLIVSYAAMLKQMEKRFNVRIHIDKPRDASTAKAFVQADPCADSNSRRNVADAVAELRSYDRISLKTERAVLGPSGRGSADENETKGVAGAVPEVFPIDDKEPTVVGPVDALVPKTSADSIGVGPSGGFSADENIAYSAHSSSSEWSFETYEVLNSMPFANTRGNRGKIDSFIRHRRRH